MFRPTVIALTTDPEIANPFRGYYGPAEDPSNWPTVDRRLNTLIWSNIETSNVGNTAHGTYDFSAINSVASAVGTVKGKFGFRVKSADPDHSGTILVPQYVWNSMAGAYTNSSNGAKVPDFDDADYLSAASALIQALAAHVATGSPGGVPLSQDPRLGWIEPGFMGLWGEWHIEGTGYNAGVRGNQAWSVANGQQIINLWRQYFPNTRLVMVTADNSVLTYALGLDSRYSWRHDCMGDPSLDSIAGAAWLVTYANRWQTAPIMGERCSGALTVGSQNGSPTSTAQLTYDQVIKYHWGALGDWNGVYSGANSTDQSFIRQYRKLAGYRFQLNSLALNVPAIVRGQVFTATANWSNVGVTPAYNSWNITYQLRNPATPTVATWTSPASGLNLQTLLPTVQWSSWTGGNEYTPTASGDAPVNRMDSWTVPTTVAAGTYNLVVQVNDALAYYNPLSLAITGRQADGSYLLGTVTVQ